MSRCDQFRHQNKNTIIPFYYLFLFNKSYMNIFLISFLIFFFGWCFHNRSPAVDNDRSFFRCDVFDDNIPELQQRVHIFRNPTVRPGCKVILGHPFFLVSLKCRYILNHLSTCTYLMPTIFNLLFISAVITTHRVGQSDWRQLKRCQHTCRHSQETHSRFTFLVQKRNKDGHFTFSTTSLLTVYCSNTSCISGLTRKGPKRMSSFSGQYWRHFIYQMWSKNFRLIYGLESEIHVSLLESMFYYSEIYSISFLK